jgi:glycine betaine catabolism A
MPPALAPALPPATSAMMARIRVQLATGKADWQSCSEAEAKIPARNYVDPAIWQAEQQHLFRALPLIAAHSSELAPGQVLAHDGYGVPLLLTRDSEGQVRCFLNVCRHRGMRLEGTTNAPHTAARSCTGVVCPYHGWAYQLDGSLRHMLHAQAFDACPDGGRDLVALPCAERHGLIWVVPQKPNQAPENTSHTAINLDEFLDGLNGELPFLEIANLRHFRTVEAEYPANWKLIMDAFLEPYHIRMLHKETIYPFFTDGITSAAQFGPHIYSLVARRPALEWANAPGSPAPADLDTLRRLATPTQTIFPNTVTIFHPDYLSLITVYPTSAETLRWTHKMLIPADKTTSDWTAHWEKTFQLVEKGVFQAEDIHCAIEIQQGLKTGTNADFSVGRIEQGVAWFHAQVKQAIDG